VEGDGNNFCIITPLKNATKWLEAMPPQCQGAHWASGRSIQHMPPRQNAGCQWQRPRDGGSAVEAEKPVSERLAQHAAHNQLRSLLQSNDDVNKGARSRWKRMLQATPMRDLQAAGAPLKSPHEQQVRVQGGLAAPVPIHDLRAANGRCCWAARRLWRHRQRAGLVESLYRGGGGGSSRACRRPSAGGGFEAWDFGAGLFCTRGVRGEGSI